MRPPGRAGPGRRWTRRPGVSAAGADDDVVIAAARDEDRILLTEDRDFGQLVYAQGHRTGGVLYLRVHPRERALPGRGSSPPCGNSVLGSSGRLWS